MTRESQEFKARKKRKIIAGCTFLAIIFFITLLKGGSLFQHDIEVLPKTGTASLGGKALSPARNDGSADDAANGMKDAEANGDATNENGQSQSGLKGWAGELIVVDVAGAVKKPGILVLEEGSRVYEALASAGGITEKADLRDINQAQVLSDGEKLYIPTAEEYEAENCSGGLIGGSSFEAPSIRSSSGPVSAAANRTGKSGKVNINIANSSELQTLSGVGPSTAERILLYRKENGKFGSIDDLKNVKGIGDKTFEKLKDHICVK